MKFSESCRKPVGGFTSKGAKPHGFEPCLVRVAQLPYPVGRMVALAEAQIGRKPVTVGGSLRINKQLCWVARLVEGQGGD
jgi:hypothetical protein